MLSDEEIIEIAQSIMENPTKIFKYKDDEETFNRILQYFFNKSKLGTLIEKIERIGDIGNGEQLVSNSNDETISFNNSDLQLLYDTAYEFIPRKMDSKVSDEAIKKTSEKTIARLIRSKNNRYYNNLESVDSILVNRFDLYPWETYSQETLISIYINTEDVVNIFFEIYPVLNKESIKTCFDNSDNSGKCLIADYIIDNDDSENNKELINELGNMFLRYPEYLKYYDGELDRYSLIILIGKALKSEKYNEIKNLLLQKNISEEMIKTIENLFKMNYNHDLDSEIVFDD
jgi:hypothetical protein